MILKDDYYTQRNNQERANAACMPTERVMFYLSNKLITNTQLQKFVDDFNARTGLTYAADDVFMHLLNTPEAIAFCAQKYPWAAPGGYPPNEVHGMYNSYLDELVLGKRVSDFRQDLSFEQIVERVKAGQHVMTCGSFQARGYTIPGHAFGFDDLDIQGQLLSTDPWGDPWTLYDSDQGYHVPWTRDQFDVHVKAENEAAKWGHIITA